MGCSRLEKPNPHPCIINVGEKNHLATLDAITRYDNRLESTRLIPRQSQFKVHGAIFTPNHFIDPKNRPIKNAGKRQHAFTLCPPKLKQ